ncbi:MAG: cbb3-type cytochrome oxidase assembly protein [Opitutales bacterium]
MDVSSYTDLLPIIVLGVLFFISAAGALYWAAKRGQFRNFDQQARDIFTEEEPEGEVSDRFPDKKKDRS